MADQDHDESLSDEERRRRERDRREGRERPSLDEEIVRKYDPARLKRVVAEGAGRGDKLDLQTRSEMARVLPGQDFSDVRVFRGPLAEEVTRRHGADAVTIGGTGMILVRESSRSAPGTAAGKALLAHELTHVAQARQGMVFAKEGGASGDGEHEREAEAVEARMADEAGGAAGGATIEKEQARRARVMARVMELAEEEMRTASERSGR